VAALPSLVRQQFDNVTGLPRSRAKRRMAKAIALLSTQLHQQTQNEPGLEGMGSTVACALVRDNLVLVAHMGDSRAYRFRGGRLKQLTKDHSLIRLLLESGDITHEEAAAHPARGRLTRNIGMEGEPLPQTRLLTFKPGDVLLLCTDGLTGTLSDPQIESILNESSPLEKQCHRMVDAANQAGGTDNITVLLLSLVGVQKKPDSSLRHAESEAVLGSTAVKSKPSA
jgi:serine/threonine protein phosphatase PrpC